MAQLSTTTLINDPNLQAYYKLEDTSDSGPNGHTLTNTGGVTFTAAKYNNGANLGMSNTTKYLHESNNLGITGGAISIVGWVKLLTELSGVGLSQYILFMQSDATTNFVDYDIRYQYNAGNPNLLFVRNPYGHPGGTITYPITLGITNFYHFALTCDASGNMNGYVNGVNVGSVTNTNTGLNIGHIDGYFIGVDDELTPTSDAASALFDDNAVFNRALTAAEVLLLAKDTSPSVPLMQLLGIG